MTGVNGEKFMMSSLLGSSFKNSLVIIDFWASWCGPCMKMLPIMEKLAAKYKDQVIFYKVNADVERELCRVYDIEALPTFFFIPVGGKPIVEVGARPENFESIIQEQLLKKK